MLKELLINLKDWQAWDFSAFKLEKDDAEILIPILEKATPKRPLIIAVDEMEIIGTCPNCGLNNHMDFKNKQKIVDIKTHCPNCGQLLNWGKPYKML